MCVKCNILYSLLVDALHHDRGVELDLLKHVQICPSRQTSNQQQLLLDLL